jgi:hypothetical protein
MLGSGVSEIGESTCVKLLAMCIDRKELLHDIQKSASPERSLVFRQICEEEQWAIGGEPCGAVILDYEFGPHAISGLAQKDPIDLLIPDRPHKGPQNEYSTECGPVTGSRGFPGFVGVYSIPCDIERPGELLLRVPGSVWFGRRTGFSRTTAVPSSQKPETDGPFIGRG